MEWKIVPFEGIGPISFGMTPAEVAAKIGSPESVDEDEGYLREYRTTKLPIIVYGNGVVEEIEVFHDVDNVTFRDRRVFDEP